MDDFIDMQPFHSVYWRSFYFYYFFYNPLYFFSIKLFLKNFFNYFWIIKLYRISYDFNLGFFTNFEVESDNSIIDFNSNLDFSVFFCIEMIFPTYPLFFKKVNTKYTNMDYKHFELLFELPRYVDFYDYDEDDIKVIKKIHKKRTMQVRKLHYLDKLTRSLKRGLVK